MNTMAAVAKTSPSDGRIACPQCGGLVHPIAGKCKHCKADLAEARGARPAAAAALPALAGGGKARPPVKADATPIPAKPSPVRAIAAAAAEPDSILPPRETGRMPVQKSKGSLLKNWPVLVIILAGLAIAAAVVLMVWPASSTAKADTRLPPPPAPERMDTNPLPPKGSMVTPPPSGTDPWTNKGTPDPDDQPNIDPDDPAADPLNPRANNLGMNMLGNGIMFSVFEHACTRMTSCGNSALAPFCSTLSQAFGPMPAPTCAAAQRCIERIDALPCDAAMSSQADILTMMGTLQDCSEAASC
jgi:hypothetical protein